MKTPTKRLTQLPTPRAQSAQSGSGVSAEPPGRGAGGGPGKRRDADRHQRRRDAASTMFFFTAFPTGTSASSVTRRPNPGRSFVPLAPLLWPFLIRSTLVGFTLIALIHLDSDECVRNAIRSLSQSSPFVLLVFFCGRSSSAPLWSDSVGFPRPALHPS